MVFLSVSMIEEIFGVAKSTSPVLEPYRGTVGGRSHARLCQWNDVHGHVSPMEDVH